MAEINLPIIMFTFSGSSPDSHFLLRLMPSRSTSTLRVTSNSDTTLKKNGKTSGHSFHFVTSHQTITFRWDSPIRR